MGVQVFNNMLGKVMTDVSTAAHQEELYFKSDDGKVFRFYHQQDCCEQVSIEDICGDLTDLVGSPILTAEEVDGLDNFEEDPSAGTWTFYKFATANGHVTVRWLGVSNGYYSERVDYFEE